MDLELIEGVETQQAITCLEELVAAKIGCYDALQAENYYGRGFLLFGDLISDHAIASGTKREYYEIDSYEFGADNLLIEGIWTDIYAAIGRANYLLHFASELELNEEMKNSIMAEVKFIRALCYFNLRFLFGNVPLYTQAVLQLDEEAYQGKADLSSIDSLILSDLEEAKNKCLENGIFFASKAAAKALLARFHLYRGEFELAEHYASALINEVEPEPTFSKLFQDPENAKGIIWAIEFNANDKNRLAEYVFPQHLGGRYEVSPEMSLFSMYDENDFRKQVTFQAANEQVYCAKYKDLSTGANTVIVFRLAEMLLIRAEANLHLKPANYQQLVLSDLNVLRNRANADSLFSEQDSELMRFILRERSLEFCFENHRWFDLLRLTMLSELTNIPANFPKLLPIPESELQLNPKLSSEDQNPGY